MADRRPGWLAVSRTSFIPLAIGCSLHAAQAQPAEQRTAPTSMLEAQLLRQIPTDEAVEVDAIGSPAEQEMGLEIASFLREHGYVVSTLRVGAMSPSPDGPVTLIHDGSKWYLEVAPGVP